MNCTKPINQINATDPHNFSGWKQLLQNRKCFRVVVVVEDGNQDFLVADVEVCVACREPFVFVADHFGHRQLDNLQFVAVLINDCLAECHSSLLSTVICVVLVVFISADDGCWVDESGQVVNVAVGVVAQDSIFQPNKMASLQGSRIGIFSISFLPRLRIAVTVQQTLLSGKEGAFAVDIYGAAFQTMPGLKHFNAFFGLLHRGFALSFRSSSYFSPQELKSQ